MPGVQRFFSKSVPPQTGLGQHAGCAPTRTTSSIFGPPQSMASVTSKTPAVKQPRVLADLLAVQPHGGAELRLVDAQEWPIACALGRRERGAVPEPVALLARDAGVGHQGGCGQRAPCRTRFANEAPGCRIGPHRRRPGGEEWARPGTGTVCRARRGDVAGATVLSSIRHSPSSGMVTRWARPGRTQQANSKRANGFIDPQTRWTSMRRSRYGATASSLAPESVNR